jgi:hypothetical protein
MNQTAKVRLTGFQFGLRSHLLAMLVCSIGIGLVCLNVVEHRRSLGSHPAGIIAVFHRFLFVWLITLVASLLAAIYVTESALKGTILVLATVALVALITNLLLPFGLL